MIVPQNMIRVPDRLLVDHCPGHRIWSGLFQSDQQHCCKCFFRPLSYRRVLPRKIISDPLGNALQDGAEGGGGPSHGTAMKPDGLSCNAGRIEKNSRSAIFCEYAKSSPGRFGNIYESLCEEKESKGR